MYNMECKTLFRVVDYKNNKVSEWFPSQGKVVEYLLNLYKWKLKPVEVLDRIKFNNKPEIERREFEQLFGRVYVMERYLAIYDNWGRQYTPANMDNVFMDGHVWCYDFVDLSIYNLSSPIFCRTYRGFRREPVPHTGSNWRRLRYYRSARYKRALVAQQDDQCREYGVRDARGGRLWNDRYDWPSRNISKSWKDCTKREKQWQRQTMGEAIDWKTIPYKEDIWEDYIECIES